jgi:hypothetical protein
MRKLQKQKGQSTIEFVFVLFAFIFFLSLSYNAVVSFAVYQYFSYANFMAARAMQAGRETNAQQELASLKVMQMYVPGINVGSQDLLFSFSSKRPLARIKGWLVPRALSTDFEHPFVLIFEVPLLTLPLGEEIRQEFGTITLKTSAVLGREPSAEECRGFFDQFFSRMGGGAPHRPEDMEDNGC